MPKIPALPFVRSGVTSGLSANQAFRLYQQEARRATEETGELWTASNRSVFLQMYSATRATRGNIPTAMQSPKDLPGGGLEPVPRATVRGRGYLQAAAVFSRAIGSSEIDRLVYLVRSNEVLTPFEVEARAREDFEASATEQHGSMFRNVIEGVVFTGVERLIPSEGF